MKRCKTCEKVRFCTDCGEKMIVSKKVFQRYDEKSGERADFHRHAWRCPNKQWWNVFHHDAESDAPDFLDMWG